MNKRISLSLAFLAFVFTGLAQVPDAFNYQAVVRNSSGEVLANQNVSFRISILQGSESGTALYAESHAASTNAFGLVNLQIGKGTIISGIFSPSGWGATSHFLKVEIDPSGGSTYTHLGTSELLSVPYAFHAKTVEDDAVNDADADPNNEIQTLSLSGSYLTLSEGGGTITLPTPTGDDWGTQTVESDATLTGDGTSGDPLGVVGDLTDDQILSTVGHDLSISGGNTITIPGDDWGAQAVASDATLSGNGTGGNPLSVVGDLTDDQTLSLSENDLTISNGNTVTLLGDNWGLQTIVSDATLSGVGVGDDPLSVNGDLTDNQTLSISGNDLSISNGNSVILPSSPWGINASNVYYSGGNVGIGTSSPVNRLTMQGAGNTSYQSFHNSTTGSAHEDGLLVGTVDSRAYFWNWENGPIRFATNGTARIHIDANGYVGIGTDNPRRNLEIFGNSNSALIGFYADVPGLSDSKGFVVGQNIFLEAIVWNSQNTSLHFSTNDLRRMTITAEGYVGIGTISPDQMLSVNGNASKSSGGTSWAVYSDRRLKDLHGNYNKGLSEVIELQPVVFNYKDDNPLDLPSDNEEVGLIAQDVRKIFPEAVSECRNGYLDFNMHPINVALINAIKELKEKNDSLEEENDHLSAKVNKLESRLDEIEKLLLQLHAWK